MKIWTKIKDYFYLHKRLLDYRVEADGLYHNIVDLENYREQQSRIIENMSLKIISLKADIKALKTVLKEKCIEIARKQIGRFRGNI